MRSEPERDVREFDVRAIDGEPFAEITAALEDLSAGEALVLINDFEPEPLYAVLDRRGFEYEADRAAADEWRVRIERA